jgi:hypothetical protein
VGSAMDNDVVRELARLVGSYVGGEDCGSVGK